MATDLVFVPIIYFVYPETSNLALEEVDLIFADGGNPVKVAREIQKTLAVQGHIDVERRIPDKCHVGGLRDPAAGKEELVEDTGTGSSRALTS